MRITQYTALMLAASFLVACSHSKPKSTGLSNSSTNSVSYRVDPKNLPLENITWLKASEIEDEPPKVPDKKPAARVMLPKPKVLKPSKRKKQINPINPLAVIDKNNATSRDNPNDEGYFNANMVYDYEEGRLYQVYAAVMRLTDITLQKGERLVSAPAFGDSKRWSLAKAVSGEGDNFRHHLLIKPKRPNLPPASLTLFTNKRSYHLELHSYKNTYMSKVSWSYPSDIENLAYESELNQYQTVAADKIDPSSLNHNYTTKAIKGDPNWYPVGVFDDGKRVFIQFPENLGRLEAPALFIVKRSGKAQLVHYRKTGHYYEVDRLFERADLRVGSGSDVEVVRITYKPASKKYKLLW